MKKITSPISKALIIPFIGLLLTACTSTYYQVHKVIPENGKLTESNIVFEDSNCNITYNLWSEGGDAGFNFYNKTDNDIKILIDNSYLIINAVAYDYYRSRTFTRTENVGLAAQYTTYPYWYSNKTNISRATSSSNSASFTELRCITIPSKTSKKISEYVVSNSFFKSCDMFKYPNRKKIKTLKYDKSNSPFKFYNLITYTSKGDTNKFENKFFVSEITNLPAKEVFSNATEVNCGKKSTNIIQVAKGSAPDKFYITYRKRNDVSEH